MSQPATFTSERRLSAWILLAALGCFVALAAPFFAQQVYVADDLGDFHLPVRDFYATQLSRGESFDWMPGLYGGFYISAEGQLGGYHPGHWLLYRTLPLGAAFDLELLLSYPLLFAGTFLFFRRLVGRRDAALFGALTFTFGGFCLLHFLHPNAIAVVAHLPWLLWAIDVALTTSNHKARVAAELAIGLLTASQLLLGYPQYVWLSLLAEAAFIVWRLMRREATWSGVAWIAAALFCGVLVGALQWIPTWHLLQESVRDTSDAAFRNSGSLHPLNLVQLVAPYLFQTRVVGQNTHELGLYIGAVPLVLCVWLFANRRDWGRQRPLIRALLVCTVLATLLAAGEYGGLYRLQAWVPLANRFRFPCRAIVLVQLCLAALAAVAAGQLFAQRATSSVDRSRGHRSLVIVTLAAVGLAIVGPLIWREHVAALPLVWTGPLLIGCAAGLVALTGREARGTAVALVLFTAVDLGVYGLSYSVYGRTADLNGYVAQIERPPQQNGLRIAAPERGKFRTGDRMLLAGLSRIDGYAGLEPAKRLDYRKPEALALAGVGWVLEPAGNDARAERTWTAIRPTAPHARLVPRTLQVRTSSRPLTPPVTPMGAVRVLEDAPGRIVVETTTDDEQLLVTTESFDSGWTATVDGQRVTIVRVDGDFLGCPAAAGNHRVQLEFRPRARQMGVLVSSLGLGLLIFAACFRLIVSRPRGVL